MTIKGHGTADHDDADLFYGLGVLMTGGSDPFWDEVRRHVTSWLIIAGIGGVGYLAVSVPVQINQVLSSQERVQQDVQVLQKHLMLLEQRMDSLERAR